MKKKGVGVILRFSCIAVILMSLLASGPVFAQEGSPATQGQVALNLAGLLGISLLPGATGADAVNALTALGINPAGGWDAGALANSNFIGALYISVKAAVAAGSVSLPAGLGNADAVVAAACTKANIPRETVVNAIVAAGGDRAAATQGAVIGGGGGGPGGGGGGANPSPSH